MQSKEIFEWCEKWVTQLQLNAHSYELNRGS